MVGATSALPRWARRFERVTVVPGEDGAVAHSELKLGNGMIMVGTAGAGSSIQHAASPLDAQGVTQTTYVYIDDGGLDAHYAAAKAAGAEITRDFERKDYGGGGYSARDLEGHEWSFGSYMPEYPATPDG